MEYETLAVLCYVFIKLLPSFAISYKLKYRLIRFKILAMTFLVLVKILESRHSC